MLERLLRVKTQYKCKDSSPQISFLSYFIDLKDYYYLKQSELDFDLTLNY